MHQHLWKPPRLDPGIHQGLLPATQQKLRHIWGEKVGSFQVQHCLSLLHPRGLNQNHTSPCQDSSWYQRYQHLAGQAAWQCDMHSETEQLCARDCQPRMISNQKRCQTSHRRLAAERCSFGNGRWHAAHPRHSWCRPGIAFGHIPLNCASPCTPAANGTLSESVPMSFEHAVSCNE